jgi:hypothetical protein
MFGSNGEERGKVHEMYQFLLYFGYLLFSYPMLYSPLISLHPLI